MSAQNIQQHLAHLFSTSYNTTEWFVSFKQAVAGLTHEQATQQMAGQSIFGIVAHLTYWNGRYLNKMKGLQQSSPMIKDNEQTFLQQNNKTWAELLQQAEQVFEGWTEHLGKLSEKDAEHFGAIANTAMHNAYHIGQIVTLRKLQGSWDAGQEVK